MNTKVAVITVLLSVAALAPEFAAAQTTNYTENFTGTSTTNQWTFLNGACLTAGTTATSTATNPACVGLTYYVNKEGTSHTFLGGYNGTFPDPASGGALRFTNKLNESGAILSYFTYPLATQGLAVSFTTVTYDGDSGGAGGDGADGMSFFLQDASYPADVGAFGGSLAYTCSNANNDSTINANTGLPRGYDGLQGGYVGLGIDEYGNFLNGTTNTLGESGTSATGDNTASGGGYKPGRIGMRGTGSISWASLTAQYPTYYPSSLTTLNQSGRASAVQDACRTGLVADWSSGSKVALTTATPIAILPPNASSYASGASPVYGDYTAIPAAYKVLPTTQPIAAESAGNRGNASPITYNLKITPAGLLSLSYSYNGGANQAVINNVDITQGGANPLPTNIRFGFAGSTGGSRNVHEIMCFQATPSNTSSSSAGLNQKQAAKVQTGSQVYFAYYNPQTLAGSLTSQYLTTDTTGTASINPNINWDASCVLTGVPLGQNCDSTGPAGTGSPLSPPSSRTILSWNYNFSATSGTVTTTQGTAIPFEWASLNSNEQALLDSGDATPITQLRLNYLRGDRSQEQVATTTTTFTGIYRDRVSVLGDIVDSSPTYVGQPSWGWPNSWADLLHSSGDPLPENSGETYSTYASWGTAGGAAPNEGQRTNVVYAGANDGMLHGFRTGAYNANGTVNTTNNDGTEVLAYVPGYTVNTIQNATNVARNYSDPQYGHKFDVDAVPGTGDLFYNGVWHTWLVSGMGPGGKAIFALDVTDPDSMFSESNATNVVMGEWSTQSITCTNNSTCGTNLGNTYGTPQIRRLHNGNWAAIFGNGYGSASGDAGIFIMLVSSTGTTSFYYLSTGVGSVTSPNGISYTAAADLDGDSIIDYVYAGDLQGNLWRFDLTSTSASSWAVTPNPVYTTPSAQPITTMPLILAIPGKGPYPHVMVEFGTGRQIPQNLISAATYQTAQMGLYGVWDWNMSSWNSASAIKYAVPFGTYPGQPTVPAAYVAGTTNLVQQTITSTAAVTGDPTATDYRTVSANAVCYADVSGCSAYGWYLNLASGYPNSADPAVPLGTAAVPGATVLYEQITFNPTLILGAFVVNTTIPPQNSATACYSAASSGWTMAIDPSTGGSLPVGFFEDNTPQHNVTNQNNWPVSGEATGGTGTPSFVSNSNSGSSQNTSQSGTGNQDTLISQTPHGGISKPINGPGNVKGKRVTWIQKR